MPVMSKFVNSAAVLAAVFASQATAHTYVKEFEAGGKTYKGFYAADKSGGDDSSPAWRTNQGWGFQPVFGDKINDPDIIAHIDAEPSPFTAPVEAGSNVKFTWQHDGECTGVDGDEVGWDCSHHGWTATWLAPCNGDCAKVDKTSLSFFKIHQAGLLDYPAGTRYAQGSATEDTGYWGTDEIFYKNGNSQTVTIPKDLPSGNYVLRTEVASVHNNGAISERQFWPQALNIAITGGNDGAQVPAGIPATQIYSTSDPQLTFDLYQHEAGITFDAPGPAVVSIAGGSGSSSGDSYSSGGDSSSAPAAPASSAPAAPASSAPETPASSAAPAVPVQSSYAAQPIASSSQPAQVTSTYTSAVYVTATATATAPAFNASSAANYGPEPTDAPQYPESGEGEGDDSDGEEDEDSDEGSDDEGSDDEGSDDEGSDDESDSDDEADNGEHDSYDWGNADYNDGEPSAWGGEHSYRQHARDFLASLF